MYRLARLKNIKLQHMKDYPDKGEFLSDGKYYAYRYLRKLYEKKELAAAQEEFSAFKLFGLPGGKGWQEEQRDYLLVMYACEQADITHHNYEIDKIGKKHG